MPKLGIQIDNNIKQTTSDFKKLNTTIDGTGKEVDKVESKTKKFGATLKTALAGTATLLAAKAIKDSINLIGRDMDEATRKTLTFASSLKGLFALAGQSGIQRGRKLATELAGRGITAAQTGQALQGIISGAPTLSAAQQDQVAREAAALDEAGAVPFDTASNLISKLISSNPKEFGGAGGVKAAANFVQRTVQESGVLAGQAKAFIKPASVAASTGISASELSASFATLTTGKVGAEESATTISNLAFKYKEYTDGGGTLGFTEWVSSIALLPAKQQKAIVGEDGQKALGVLAGGAANTARVTRSLGRAKKAGVGGASFGSAIVQEVEAENADIALANIKRRTLAQQSLEAAGIAEAGLVERFGLQAERFGKNIVGVGAGTAGAIASELPGGFQDIGAGLSAASERAFESVERIDRTDALIGQLSSSVQSQNATNQVTRKTQGGQ